MAVNGTSIMPFAPLQLKSLNQISRNGMPRSKLMMVVTMKVLTME